MSYHVTNSKRLNHNDVHSSVLILFRNIDRLLRKFGKLARAPQIIGSIRTREKYVYELRIVSDVGVCLL